MLWSLAPVIVDGYRIEYLLMQCLLRSFCCCLGIHVAQDFSQAFETETETYTETETETSKQKQKQKLGYWAWL